MPADINVLKLPRFQQPENWQWRNFKSSGDFDMRYGFVLPEGEVKSVIVCLPGFAEFAEKYFEIAHHMLAHGFGFFIMDWLGQGGSQRLLSNRYKIHSTGFDQHLMDLRQFLFEHVQPEAKAHGANAPVIFLGHSMGGHLGLRYLHDNPDSMVQRAAFTAPMISISQLNRIPPKFVTGITAFFNLFGSSYAASATDWPLSNNRTSPGQGRHTSDPIRDTLEKLWFDSNPALQVGGPTYRWLYEAFRSCQKLADPQYLRDIHTPVLIAIAGQDKIVASGATRIAVKNLSNATILELPAARHEILMESDAIRNEFLAAFDRFVYTP